MNACKPAASSAQWYYAIITSALWAQYMHAYSGIGWLTACGACITGIHKTCSTCTCTRNIQYAHTVTARNMYSMRNLNQITSIMYPAQHTLQILVTGTVRTTGHQWLTLSSQHYSRSTVHEHHGSRCTNQQYNVPTYEW